MKNNIIEQIKPCPYHKKCGGCSLQNLSYSDQLHFKQVRMIRLLGVFGHVEEILGMDDPLRYRNKVQAGFLTLNGAVASGVYQSSTGRIVPVDGCLIQNEAADKIIATLRKLFQSFKLKPYDSVTKKGFIRHVLVRQGHKSGQIMVVIVTAEGEFPSKRSFINALINRHPEITTIVRNINKDMDGLFLGEESEILLGDGYIEDSLCDMSFRISPSSFYQVNSVQAEKLYTKAIELLELTGKETVIDAYCGTGTIGLILSKKAKNVIGIELNKAAVDDAVYNARLNNADNISFINDDAGRILTEIATNREKIDAVITDPPRAGCSKEFLRSLVALSPKRIVYISCNPETLLRDLLYLRRKGYRAEVIQPVDMFPYTSHIEAIVLLTKEKPTGLS